MTSRIDDDARILEAATEGPWSVSADQCGNGWVRELETNDDGGIPIEDAICIATARNRMHLYLALARAVIERVYDSTCDCVVCKAIRAIEAREENPK